MLLWLRNILLLVERFIVWWAAWNAQCYETCVRVTTSGLCSAQFSSCICYNFNTSHVYSNCKSLSNLWLLVAVLTWTIIYDFFMIARVICANIVLSYLTGLLEAACLSCAQLPYCDHMSFARSGLTRPRFYSVLSYYNLSCNSPPIFESHRTHFCGRLRKLPNSQII